MGGKSEYVHNSPLRTKRWSQQTTDWDRQQSFLSTSMQNMGPPSSCSGSDCHGTLFVETMVFAKVADGQPCIDPQILGIADPITNSYMADTRADGNETRMSLHQFRSL